VQQRDRWPRLAKITLQEILLTSDIERGKFAEGTTAVLTEKKRDFDWDRIPSCNEEEGRRRRSQS